ncbi:U4/U6 small nuclear ribonucleoprotein Prp4 [Thraustotheca clavata]|uniref:U4/U6 small nuclear ribonucleoprotein Prp4 n=1 Tax=Thraustotheca clavata TaxID=74557 RepID=A0A1V9ZVY3_9STRA|nr:U4/U6 small nuclear ribonucleoprotein Prp4 [Thraustotheca clavata]
MSERNTIHFGAVPLSTVHGSSSVQAGIRAGNINTGNSGEKEVLELSLTSRLAQEKHAQQLQKLDADRRARSVQVPTRTENVINQLRNLGQPITLFGEKPEDRRARLRGILAELHQQGDIRKVLEAQKAANRDQLQFGYEKEKKVVQEDQLFYIQPKSNDLKIARHHIFKNSLTTTSQRLQNERQLMEGTAFDGDKIVAALYRDAQEMALHSSQLADVRPLSHVRYSPDASLLATGSWSSSVKVWNSSSCEHVHTYQGHTDRITGLAWHPKSTTESPCLASGSADHTAMIWKGTSTTPAVTLKGHQHRLGQIAFHPLGTYLATTSFDHSWRLWDIERGTELLVQEGHYREVYAIACQPDGSLLVTGDLNGLGRVWDLRSGKSILPLQGHAKQIVSISWNPNSHVVATGSDDHTIRVWDLRKRQNVYVVPAHDAMVSTVCYSSSGEVLASASFDGSMKLWRTRNWTCLNVLKGHDGKVMSLDMAPDEKRFVTAGWDRTFKISMDKREDGRSVQEIRPLACEQGLLNRADGSARFNHGTTSVMASVSGPAPAKIRRQENVNQATLDVVFKAEKGVATARDKEYELILRQTFEPIILLENFPRTVISITVQVVEDDGSLLAVSINAINLALMDAGIPMRSVVGAITCSVLEDSQLCIDPSLVENDTATATVTTACSANNHQILTSFTSGILTEEQYFACSEICRRAIDSVIAFVRISQESKFH